MNASPYAVQFSPTAARQTRKLSVKQRKLVLRVCDALAINPRPPGATKIHGMTGLYRESVQGLRLVYKIDEQSIVLLFVSPT